MNPEVSIVVPLFNEEKVFSMLIDRLKKLIQSANFPLEIILVDDGSSDSTASLIENAVNTDEHFTGVLLSKNHGHQLAVSAGLSITQASQAVMIIDGDLQDP